jgi:hypothetical protein
MVTAGSLFAAADKDATEDLFVMSRPVSFLNSLFIGIFVGGVLPGWHVIVGDNQCGTNPYV